MTWYAAATDPWIARPGYPNNVYSFRSDYEITDDGWWSGANDLVGAPCNSGGGSDRYVTGPNRHFAWWTSSTATWPTPSAAWSCRR